MRLPLAVRRPWMVLILGLAAMVTAALTGGDVQDSLSPGGFSDPGSESARATALLDDTFGAGTPDLVLVVDSEGGVDDPATVADGLALTDELAARDDVDVAASY